MSSSQVTSQSEEKETDLVITNVSSDVQDNISSDNTTVSQGILILLYYIIIFCICLI